MADNKKLSDDEKRKLIGFYKENPILWDSNNPYYKNKEKKESVKGNLAELFDNIYTADQFEKCFHSLRSSMLREVKKNAGLDVPSKKWKFYNELEFIIPDLTKEKKKTTSFSNDETEELIEFYRDNPALWNHTLQDYRDRNLRECLMAKLNEQFAEKFTIAEMKACWHNLLTTFKREKKREEGSKASGSGLSEVYYSTWEFFNMMEFTEVTCDMDETVTSIIDDEKMVEPQSKKKKKATDEQGAKADLWRALTESLNNKSNANNSQKQPDQGSSKSQSDLEKRAHLFGDLIADNLLQCETRDWTLLKKKIMDIFFEYEQQKQIATTPYQNYYLTPRLQDNSFSSMLQSTPNNASNVPAPMGPFSPSNSSLHLIKIIT